jgi:hypothetical protein
LQALLCLLLADTRRGRFVFPFSAQTLRSRFHQVCAELGLSEQYVPHSLRHGGATRLHLQGVSMEDILLRGRWASTKSARRYVQAGRAQLMAMAVPADLAAAARVLAADIPSAWSLSQAQVSGGFRLQFGRVRLR